MVSTISDFGFVVGYGDQREAHRYPSEPETEEQQWHTQDISNQH